MDLTPFQKLLVARVFREQPASRALFEDFVSNQLRLGDCRMSADEIDATDKSDASFQRSAAIAEAHEHEMVLNGTHPRYSGYPVDDCALDVEMAPEIPVTDEMSDAALLAFDSCEGTIRASLEASYRAMAAVAPKPAWHSESTGNHSYLVDLRDKLARKSEAAMRVSDDKDATIAALRAQIAAFTVQNVRSVAGEEVTATPSPFRDFLGDPRRIGGMS